MKSHNFVATTRAFITAGNGGNGCVCFRREKSVPRGGPDGGDGGRGGHVIIQADLHINSLISIDYHPHQRADNGINGKSKKSHGRNGKDLVFKVPCGTEIRDNETGKQLGDLIKDGSQLLIAHGGNGGRGNHHWKIGSRQTPDEEYAEGKPGEIKTIRLELKIIADAGLIGFPNAGKSTLLSVISNAHPRIASYPFTTLNPIVGTIINETFNELTIVDIPGLIKDAHEGVGLGHSFLRHIERTQLLIFVIDMAGTDRRNPTDDYFTLVNELNLHNAELSKRPSFIVANKMDVPGAEEKLVDFKKTTGLTPLPISALTRQGIDQIKQTLYDMM